MEKSTWRAEFPVAREWAYYDHAAVAPLCKRAARQVSAWNEDLLANGAVNEGDWWRQVESARLLAARLLHAKPDEIALLKNTSEGLAMIAEGFPWQPGDNVIIPAGEYPANVYPWLHLAARGVETRVIVCRGPRVEIADLRAAMDNRTRLLAISHVQFASGFRSDLAALADICRRRGIDFCVDAIQGLGVFPIDVEAMGIDYLAADGHKWLLAPEGGAIFYVRAEKIDKLRPVTVGWKSVARPLDFSNIDFTLKSDASRFECGSYHMPCLVGLQGSLEYLQEIGIATIHRAVADHTEELCEQLRRLGATIYSDRGAEVWSGIVSFTLPHTEARAVALACRHLKVILSARAGRLRVSPHFYNDASDMQRLLDALREASTNATIPVPDVVD